MMHGQFYIGIHLYTYTYVYVCIDSSSSVALVTRENDDELMATRTRTRWTPKRRAWCMWNGDGSLVCFRKTLSVPRAYFASAVFRFRTLLDSSFKLLRTRRYRERDNGREIKIDDFYTPFPFSFSFTVQQFHLFRLCEWEKEYHRRRHFFPSLLSFYNFIKLLKGKNMRRGK